MNNYNTEQKNNTNRNGRTEKIIGLLLMIASVGIILSALSLIYEELFGW